MSVISMIRNIIERAKRLLGLCSEEPLLRLGEVLGFEPRNISYYQLAFTHSSCSLTDEMGQRINNERLEYLGDSVLATAVSHHLYLNYPHWNEGELSKRRGAMVKRAVNNAVAKRMGLHKMLRYNREMGQRLSPDTYGNTLEALIGAIFLDQGYLQAEMFVLTKVLPLFQELEDSLVEQTTNYKSLLLEWVQQHHLDLDFKMLQEPKRSGGLFVCAVYIDGKRISSGRGSNKKEAHQEAAHAALAALRKVDPTIPISDS
ncbi:ribonuclease III [Porphyromonas sp. COT-290 OH3588]|uniref:ribonuclease III n=1 Tax=Porphyromonas sp. COT-290 OH3588 TaxID=1515617 RepID=UPI000AA057E0|nr:ribonuclease III [Porphyromonas sp. COT-290 OH3588]